MQISVCIPVFNTYLHELVEALHFEIESNNLVNEVEIILIDDGSAIGFQLENQKLKDKAKYIELTENVGRSKIRNLFLNYSEATYFLFLDGDSLIPEKLKNHFLQNYISALSSETKCICGGRVYPELTDIKGIELNYNYGVKIESKPTEIRKLNPNRSFMTNNFLIERTIFEKIRFDENLSMYGHEDTLFGLRLNAQKIRIKHIENPVLNGFIEKNTKFLDKTDSALKNLYYIYNHYPEKKELVENVRLLSWYKSIDFFPLKQFILLIFGLFKSKIRKTLKEGSSNLKLFNFYKLGVFLQINKQKESSY